MENSKFASVYSQSTFSGVFTNLESFIPNIYKRGLSKTLFHRSFGLCSNYESFQQETETLKSIFKHNYYLLSFRESMYLYVFE